MGTSQVKRRMLNRKWKEFYTYIRNSYEKKKQL